MPNVQKRRMLIAMLGLIVILAACNSAGGAPQEPTVEPFNTQTAQPFVVERATRTPISNNAVPTVTPLFANQGAAPPPTANVPPTAIPPTAIPPTVIRADGPIPNTRYLQGGRGISSGAIMNNGNFEVETFCSLLNVEYGVSRDSNDWFCTFAGQRALTLREHHYTEICDLTYNNDDAFAYQISGVGEPALGWRCLEYTILPSPTPQLIKRLLQNGRGLSTGNPMNDGNFEVEAYCSQINSSYGVNEDGNFWYCTQEGRNVLTLGVAEFDDICFRTYNRAGAFAEQVNNSDPAAYRWRCYIYE